MEALSSAEEQLMKHLWVLKRCFMRNLLEVLPEPKPAKTTVATLLRRMIDKGVVGYRTYGNSREYYPLVSKQVYFGRQLRGMVRDFFSASPTELASLLTGEAKLSQDQLRELQRLIDKKLEEQ